MRTTIKFDGCNNVTVARDDPYDGVRRETIYFAPHMSGDALGYVRIRDQNNSQVCEGLASTGSTLMATPDSLLRVIRRENKRRRGYETA